MRLHRSRWVAPAHCCRSRKPWSSDIVACVPSVPAERPGSQRGAGLLSLLMVVAVIGVLVVTSMSANDFQLDMEPPGGTLPESSAGAVKTPAPSPAPARPRDAARQAVCEANYRAVETALASEQAASGTLSLTVEELVRDGWLSPSVVTDDPGITLEVANGAPTGRVLVDGQPGPAACGLR